MSPSLSQTGRAADEASVRLAREIHREVERARREWLAARAYFESVSDPALVDHAVFSVVAAERKYMYLLRLARELRVSAPLFPAAP